MDVAVGEDPEVDLSGAGQSLHSAGGAYLRFGDCFRQCKKQRFLSSEAIICYNAERVAPTAVVSRARSVQPGQAEQSFPRRSPEVEAEYC